MPKHYIHTLDVINVINVIQYNYVMIISSKDREPEKVWDQIYSKRLPHDIQRIGLRKLIILHSAKDLNDRKVPPGNRLELVSGNREGQHRIRINDQWRICFRWNQGQMIDAEIVDHH
jgi:toxin HigB-1